MTTSACYLVSIQSYLVQRECMSPGRVGQNQKGLLLILIQVAFIGNQELFLPYWSKAEHVLSWSFTTFLKFFSQSDAVLVQGILAATHTATRIQKFWGRISSIHTICESWLKKNNKTYWPA